MWQSLNIWVAALLAWAVELPILWVLIRAMFFLESNKPKGPYLIREPGKHNNNPPVCHKDYGRTMETRYILTLQFRTISP